MYNYNYGHYGQYNSSGYGQQQKQMSKVEQIQDQAYSYEVMGNLFSALEYYAAKCINQPPTHQFDYYNNFDCGNKKTKEELRNQIITQLEIFKYSYLLYIQKHGEYIFPNSLSKDKVESLINGWVSQVHDPDEKYFNAVLDILNQKEVSYVNELRDEGGYSTVDPRAIGDFNKVIAQSQKFGEDVKRQYQNNPDYEPNIQIGQRNKGMYEYINKEKQERVNLENELKAEFHIIENLKNLKNLKMEQELYILFDFFSKFQRYKNQYKIIPFTIDETSYITVENLINKTVTLSSSDITNFKSILKELRFKDDDMIIDD